MILVKFQFVYPNNLHSQALLSKAFGFFVYIRSNRTSSPPLLLGKLAVRNVPHTLRVSQNFPHTLFFLYRIGDRPNFFLNALLK